VKGANDRFPETQKPKMKASKKSETAAFTFNPFAEAQAQLAQLVDSVSAQETVNLKQVRAMWGFSLLVPFPKQWEDVPAGDKKRIRGEAESLIKAMRPTVSEATIGRVLRNRLGFVIKEKESDPLATAKAQLRASAKAHKNQGVTLEAFLKEAAAAFAAAETKEA
jgi:hypothetical protein